MTLVLANNSTFLSLQKTKHQHGHVHSAWQISGCVPLRLVVITKRGQLRASSDVQQFYSRWQDERWQIVLQTCSIPQGTFTISTISVWSDDELRCFIKATFHFGTFSLLDKHFYSSYEEVGLWQGLKASFNHKLSGLCLFQQPALVIIVRNKDPSYPTEQMPLI